MAQVAMASIANRRHAHGMSMVITIVAVMGLVAVVSLVRTVSRDGLGLRPGPRSHAGADVRPTAASRLTL